MEKPRRKVGTPLRVLCVLLSPFLIYMAWRMHKVRKALVIVTIDFAVYFVLDYYFPWPYNSITELGFSLPFIIYFVIKWSREWNSELDGINSEISANSEQGQG